MKTDRSSSEHTVQNVNIYDYICWTEGLLQFKSETLEHILRKVERHYAVSVSIETSLETCRITGKLDLQENIEAVLKVIEKLAPVRYEIHQNQVFIHQK